MELALVLMIWTLAAAGWWIVSLHALMSQRARPAIDAVPEREPADTLLTIFKPLPPLESDDHLPNYGRCLESFLKQLDHRSELLIGVPAEEESRWAPVFERWKVQYPASNWRIVRRGPDPFPLARNAKISWQRILEKEARGDWWLWTDADILAPAGYLVRLRKEFVQNGESFLTSPYVVRQIDGWAGFLDAIFVNVELYPGIRLLARRGPVHFGLGAGMLFTRKKFQEVINWDELNAVLADDHYLGQRLQPAHVGSVEVETFSASRSLAGSIRQYFRWEKTIRWCQPGGFAAQLVILPLLGWLLATVFFANYWPYYRGLLSVLALETVWVISLCRVIGCRVKKRWLSLVPVWSLLRPLVWLACWLPGPVRWRSQIWWTPQLKTSKV